MKNTEFYNLLASNYDEMINFESSLKNKIEQLRNFITPKFKRALDLGCATGADSIALSKLGFRVDAIDHSSKMIEQAIKNAENFKVDINFIQSGLIDFNPYNKKYDIIVSLGNTLANIPKSNIERLFQNFTGFLEINGRVLIQLINYAKLPREGMYTLNEFENESLYISRKYYFQEKHIDFIITRINKSNNEKNEIKTKIFPHSHKEIKRIARENNFKTELFGNLLKETYLELQSENLVVVLTK